MSGQPDMCPSVPTVDPMLLNPKVPAMRKARIASRKIGCVEFIVLVYPQLTSTRLVRDNLARLWLGD